MLYRGSEVSKRAQASSAHVHATSLWVNNGAAAACTKCDREQVKLRAGETLWLRRRRPRPGPPPWAERKHRAWFLDRQRRGVLSPWRFLPCRAVPPRSQDPQHAWHGRSAATPPANLVRHPPSGRSRPPVHGQSSRLSNCTRRRDGVDTMKAADDGTLSPESWNTSRTIMGSGNQAAETWTAGRGGHVANGAGRVGTQGGRYFVYRPGWTVNEIPSTPWAPPERWIRHVRPRSAGMGSQALSDFLAHASTQPRDVLPAVDEALPATSASITPAPAPARRRR
jgi:hypothetical protein